MTDAERDELIEKSLQKQLDEATEARVQQLRRDDVQFRQDYDFQETLIQQVRLKRRQELSGMFARFEAERTVETNDEVTTPIIPLPSRTSQDISVTDPQVIPFWRQSWFRVAATVVLVAAAGAIVWWQLGQNDPTPIADDKRDSLKIQTPNDTATSIESPTIPQPEPRGPVAQKPDKPTLLQGPAQLLYYETDDLSLGFGKGKPTTEYRTVVFSNGPEPAYEFQDTLRVFLPTLPAAKPAWSLVYSRANDTYYLITGKTRYEVVKGLQGKQPLTMAR